MQDRSTNSSLVPMVPAESISTFGSELTSVAELLPLEYGSQSCNSHAMRETFRCRPRLESLRLEARCGGSEPPRRPPSLAVSAKIKSFWNHDLGGLADFATLSNLATADTKGIPRPAALRPACLAAE